ncbi:MAG: acetylxylan esterase, partial [Dehalococcoidia bacterium]
GCADIDSDRIALRGTSLGGGHVLAVAAADPRIAAVVSQVPFVGIELGRASPRSTRTTLALFSAAVRDTFRGFLGRPPYLIPVVGAADAVAAFPDPTAAIVLGDLAETVPTWRNAVAARVLFPLLWYRPGAQAKHLRMPLLVCIAERDTAGSVRLAMAAARQAPRGELRRYATGHWEVYRPPMIEQLASDQIRFLRTHLRLV